MPFISFVNEQNALHLNVDHIVSLELVKAPNHAGCAYPGPQAKADLTIAFPTKVEAQDLIDALIDHSLTRATASFKLPALTAKPNLLPFAKFGAGEPYEPGEQN